MSTRTHFHIPAPLAVVALVGLTVGVAASCDPVQPKPQCKVRRQPYAAAYFLEGQAPATCQGKVLSGELLHLQTYSPDPRTSNDTPGIGIEPAIVDDAVQAVERANASGAMLTPMIESEYSFGKFTTITPPDDSDFCSVGSMQRTKVSTPMVVANPNAMPHPIEAHDPIDLTYEWSAVQSVVKATLNGVHFGGSLKLTDGDCTLTYKVSGVTPAVHCGDAIKDKIDEETMMPAIDPATGKRVKERDPESGEPLQALCCPTPDNGLAPEVGYRCDKATLLCLPVGEFPSYDTAGENRTCVPPPEPLPM